MKKVEKITADTDHYTQWLLQGNHNLNTEQLCVVVRNLISKVNELIEANESSR